MKQTTINIILFLLLGVSIFFGYKFYTNNNLLALKIDSISDTLSEKNLAKKDSLLSVVEFQKTKEEYYTTQLSIQSDWIIGYVTLLFGIFGIIGFTYNQNNIKEIKENFEKSLNEYKSEISELNKEQQEDLKEIEKTLYISYAEAQSSTGFTDMSFSSKFLFYLSSSFYYQKAFQLETIEETRDRILKYLLINLKNAHISLNRESPTNNTKLKEESKQIKRKLLEISKSENEEVREWCAKLQVLLISFR